jgi:hypothetical protein
LHGEVFRPPESLSVWSLLAGSGSHCFFALIVFALLSRSDRTFLRDAAFSNALLAFVVTSPAAGFFAATISRAFASEMWLRVAAASSFLFPATLLIVYVVTAVLGAANTFSVSGIIWIIAIQIGVVAPLAVAGAFAAKAVGLYEDTKCDVSAIPRAAGRWGTGATLTVGAVCFISSAADLYYALAALWRPTALFAWGYLVAGAVALAVVAACAAVLLVYWGLQEEVHTWHWRAFVAPAATGIWAFAYGVHFVVTKTKAAGVYQVLYAVVYTAEVAVVVGLIAGGAGIVAANAFVHRIFADVKLD